MGCIPKFCFKVSFGSSKCIFPQKSRYKWWSGCLGRLVKQRSWISTCPRKLFSYFHRKQRHYRLERIWWASWKCNHHNTSGTHRTGHERSMGSWGHSWARVGSKHQAEADVGVADESGKKGWVSMWALSGLLQTTCPRHGSPSTGLPPQHRSGRANQEEKHLGKCPLCFLVEPSPFLWRARAVHINGVFTSQGESMLMCLIRPSKLRS